MYGYYYQRRGIPVGWCIVLMIAAVIGYHWYLEHQAKEALRQMQQNAVQMPQMQPMQPAMNMNEFMENFPTLPGVPPPPMPGQVGIDSVNGGFLETKEQRAARRMRQR